MEFTSVVFYQRSLAYYRVVCTDGRIFVASLRRYNGDPASSPPEAVTLSKEGRHWQSNTSEEVLADDLGLAIESRLKAQ